MATAPAPRPPAPGHERPRRRSRVAAAALEVAAAVLAAAGLLAAFGHAFLNYDSTYALVWGADLAAGRLPDYGVPVAPTPHPLAIAVGAAVSPLGDAAEDVFLAVALLGIGALAVGLARLGGELYAWPVGVLAAAILLTRVPPLNYGIRGYVDLPALALVVWAAVLEARRPRRGAAVLVLLALAGLLRPEAWLFSAAYWLWVARSRGWPARLGLAALAAAGPVVWCLFDLLVTGDPLWSLNGTSELAGRLERPTGLDVVSVLPRRLGEILRLPELIAAVLGFTAGLVWLQRRTLLPAAVAVLNGVAFLAFAAAGLPLLGRYLFLAGAMLCLFAAVAALGWTAIARAHPARTAWRAGGLGVLAGLALFLPVQLGRLADLRTDIARRDEVQADLRDLVRRPAAAAVLARCGPVFVPNHRPVPLLALWTGRAPAEIVSAGLRRPTPAGVYVAPASAAVERLSILDPRDPQRLRPAAPASYRRVAANRSWVMSAGCGPRATR